MLFLLIIYIDISYGEGIVFFSKKKKLIGAKAKREGMQNVW